VTAVAQCSECEVRQAPAFRVAVGDDGVFLTPRLQFLAEVAREQPRDQPARGQESEPPPSKQAREHNNGPSIIRRQGGPLTGRTGRRPEWQGVAIKRPKRTRRSKSKGGERPNVQPPHRHRLARLGRSRRDTRRHCDVVSTARVVRLILIIALAFAHLSSVSSLLLCTRSG